MRYNAKIQGVLYETIDKSWLSGMKWLRDSDDALKDSSNRSKFRQLVSGFDDLI